MIWYHQNELIMQKLSTYYDECVYITSLRHLSCICTNLFLSETPTSLLYHTNLYIVCTYTQENYYWENYYCCCSTAVVVLQLIGNYSFLWYYYTYTHAETITKTWQKWRICLSETMFCQQLQVCLFLWRNDTQKLRVTETCQKFDRYLPICGWSRSFRKYWLLICMPWLMFLRGHCVLFIQLYRRVKRPGSLAFSFDRYVAYRGKCVDGLEALVRHADYIIDIHSTLLLLSMDGGTQKPLLRHPYYAYCFQYNAAQ